MIRLPDLTSTFLSMSAVCIGKPATVPVSYSHSILDLDRFAYTMKFWAAHIHLCMLLPRRSAYETYQVPVLSSAFECESSPAFGKDLIDFNRKNSESVGMGIRLRRRRKNACQPGQGARQHSRYSLYCDSADQIAALLMIQGI